MTLDARNITVLANGQYLTGFAADGVFTLSARNPRANLTVGSHGDGLFVNSADKSATLTLTFLPTSASIPYLEDLCENNTEFSVTVRDTTPDRPVTRYSEGCRVATMPDVSGGGTGTTVSVEIIMPSVSRQ